MNFETAGRIRASAQSEGSMGGAVEHRPRTLVPGLGPALLQAELDFEQAIARHRDLALFRRNVATWELLLRVAREPDGVDCGVHGLVHEIGSRGLGPSALLRFIRDRRDDGHLLMSPDPGKRSRQRISLRPGLAEVLGALLLHRYGTLDPQGMFRHADARARGDGGDRPRGPDVP